MLKWPDGIGPIGQCPLWPSSWSSRSRLSATNLVRPQTGKRWLVDVFWPSGRCRQLAAEFGRGDRNHTGGPDDQAVLSAYKMEAPMWALLARASLFPPRDPDIRTMYAHSVDRASAAVFSCPGCSQPFFSCVANDCPGPSNSKLLAMSASTTAALHAPVAKEQAVQQRLGVRLRRPGRRGGVCRRGCVALDSGAPRHGPPTSPMARHPTASGGPCRMPSTGSSR